MQQVFKVFLVGLGISQLFSCGQNSQLSGWLGNDKKLSQEDSTIMSKWLLDNGLKAKDFKVVEAPKGHLGDFSVIVSEHSIQSIRASGVKDLVGLSQLSHLQSLELSHLKQSNLNNCPVQLKAIRLTGSDLKSLEGVESCHLLEEIKVVHSSVTSVNPLLALPQLKSININFSQLTKVEINHSAPALAFLDLSNNQINHFAILADLPELETLVLNNNQLSTLEHNNRTPLLNGLSLSNNLIQDLGSVTPINHLKRITIKGNPLHDLAALESWQHLQTIDFDGELSDSSAPINSKISHRSGPFELHLAEAEYLKESYLKNTEFIETLPKSIGGDAQGVSKQISSHFDTHSDPTVSGNIHIDTLNGLMRFPVVSTNDLLQFDRKIVMRGTATVQQGQLNIYNPIEEDFWDMAKLFVDTPIKQRPKDRDDLVLKGFTVNRVTAGEPVEFNANLVAIAGKYFLLLGPEHGEVTGVEIEFE